MPVGHSSKESAQPSPAPERGHTTWPIGQVCRTMSESPVGQDNLQDPSEHLCPAQVTVVGHWDLLCAQEPSAHLTIPFRQANWSGDGHICTLA